MAESEWDVAGNVAIPFTNVLFYFSIELCGDSDVSMHAA